MIITNGQILLMVIFCISLVIRKFIRKRNMFTKVRLQRISWRANENRYKARGISDAFFDAMEYFKNLSLQQWEEEDQKIIQNLIKLCEFRLCEANEIEYAWKFLGDYIDKGINLMGCNDFAEPSINIRKQFKENYKKKSVKIAKNLKPVKDAEKLLRRMYGFLYLLPEK